MTSIFPLRIPGLTTEPGDNRLRLRVHDKKDIVISKSIKEKNIWEPDETQFILSVLNRGEIFLDIGANIGYFSVLASHLLGKEGIVYAFEPEIENYKLLLANSTLNGKINIRCFQTALSDEDTLGFLYLNEENLGDHQLFPVEEQREKIEVTIRKGDSLLLAMTSRVHFIKIDTQGAEFHVLSGLSKLIEQSLPELVLLLEFWPRGLRQAGVSGLQLLELLSRFDLAFYILKAGLLIPISRKILRQWIDITNLDPLSDGFLNLICARPDRFPINGWRNLPIKSENPLHHLFAGISEELRKNIPGLE